MSKFIEENLAKINFSNGKSIVITYKEFMNIGLRDIEKAVRYSHIISWNLVRYDYKQK